MGLFGILKGMVGLGPGIEGCKKQAADGDAESQFALGGFYERGQGGLPQDYAESAEWYRKAAEQDHHAAQLYLGLHYAQGNGVEQDLVQALGWVLLAKRGGVWDRAAANETQGRLEARMTEQQINEGRVRALIFSANRGE
jgi:TPR repeat protein